MIDKLGFKTFTFNKLDTTLGANSCFNNKHALSVYLINWSWINKKLVSRSAHVEEGKKTLVRFYADSLQRCQA